jgi:predicted nuclease with RNAse H fold
MRIVGINLAATEDHVTGVAELEDNKIRTFSVYKDPDIIEIIDRFKPKIVVFDVPLVLSKEPYRCAEKEMVAFGYSPDPQNFEDLKTKIKRAINLKTSIADHVTFLETHLPSVKQSLKVQDAKQLQNVRIMNLMKNQFEKDAVFAAVVGLFYSENLYDQFGDEESSYVTIPKL